MPGLEPDPYLVAFRYRERRRTYRYADQRALFSPSPGPLDGWIARTCRRGEMERRRPRRRARIARSRPLRSGGPGGRLVPGAGGLLRTAPFLRHEGVEGRARSAVGGGLRR